MYDANEQWSEWSACEWYGHDFGRSEQIGNRVCRDCGEEESS